MSDFIFKSTLGHRDHARKVATLRELLAEEDANQAEFHTKRLRPNVAQ
ncbi:MULTISPECIES: hypothetical protein [unclassified Bradyrhizobium]|nr:hypothetical protein [Bradyrhizobium sp. 2S1]MCK7666551.1 hypothetical protein [Bradyrhizobium sp. 2S1]